MKTLLFLAIGGFVTSLAEYVFHYNLVDYLKDKIPGLFGRK